MATVTDDTGFWTLVHDELEKVHEADAALRARRRAAWDEYCERVDALIEEMQRQLDARSM